MTYQPKFYTEEAKKERFKRIATKRTLKVLEELRKLGNTANPQLYIYSETDLEKIFTEIQNKIIAVKGKFKIKPKEFTLND